MKSTTFFHRSGRATAWRRLRLTAAALAVGLALGMQPAPALAQTAAPATNAVQGVSFAAQGPGRVLSTPAGR